MPLKAKIAVFEGHRSMMATALLVGWAGRRPSKCQAGPVSSSAARRIQAGRVGVTVDEAGLLTLLRHPGGGLEARDCFDRVRREVPQTVTDLPRRWPG